MLISNQNPLLAQGTLVTLMSGAHVGHSQPSREREGEGGLLFYPGRLQCPAKLIFSFLHIKSIFNASAFACSDQNRLGNVYEKILY